MTKEKEIIYNLRILDIKVVRFSQFELFEKFNSELFPLVEYQTQFDFKVTEEEEKITSVVTVKIKFIETNEYFAELIVETSFFVSDRIAVKHFFQLVVGNKSTKWFFILIGKSFPKVRHSSFAGIIVTRSQQ